MRIALLVKLAIKATDNSDMYSREFLQRELLFIRRKGAEVFHPDLLFVVC